MGFGSGVPFPSITRTLFRGYPSDSRHLFSILFVTAASRETLNGTTLGVTCFSLLPVSPFQGGEAKVTPKIAPFGKNKNYYMIWLDYTNKLETPI